MGFFFAKHFSRTYYKHAKLSVHATPSPFCCKQCEQIKEGPVQEDVPGGREALKEVVVGGFFCWCCIKWLGPATEWNKIDPFL